MTAEFNLNYNVLVKLTDAGFAIWKKEKEKYLPEKYHKPIEHYKAQVDAEGFVSMQGHAFMSFFGEHTHPFGAHLFNMNIRVCDIELIPE